MWLFHYKTVNALWISSLTTSRPLRACLSASPCLKTHSPEALTLRLFTPHCLLTVWNAELSEDGSHFCCCSPKETQRLTESHNQANQRFTGFPCPREQGKRWSPTSCCQESGPLLQWSWPNSPANRLLESCCMFGTTQLSPDPIPVLWTHFSVSVLFATSGSYLLETFIGELAVGYWSCFTQTLSLTCRGSRILE